MRSVKRSFAVGLAYFVVLQLGAHAPVHDYLLSVVFSASGIAFASLYLFGAGVWPGLLVAGLAFSATAGETTSLLGAPVAAVANTGAVLLTVRLLRKRVDSASLFDCSRDVARFVAIGFFATVVLFAFLAAVGVPIYHPPRLSEIAAPTGSLFRPDTIGIVVVAPLLIALWEERKAVLAEERKREWTVCFSLFVAFHCLLFVFRKMSGADWPYPLHMAFLLFTPYAACRFGIRSLTAITFTISLCGIVAAIHEPGVHAGPGDQSALLTLRGSVAVLSAISLFLYGVVRDRVHGEARLLQKQEDLRNARLELERRVDDRTSSLREALDRLVHDALDDLGRAERRYRLLCENAAEGVFQSTFEGRLLTANPAMARIFGYETPEEITSVTDSAGTLYHARDDFSNWVEELRRSGEIRNREVRMRRRDGESVWALISARVLSDAEGLPVIEGILVDHTERKMAEEKLRRSEELYRRIISTTQEGYCLTDADLRILDVNDALCQVLGYGREEFIGRSAADLSALRMQDFWRQAVALESARDHVSIETAFLNRQGLEVPFFVNSSVIRNESGEIVARVAFLTDVTEMKRAEILRQDVERIMRHDLKTPLTAIISSPKILRKSANLRPEHTRLLDIIENAGYRMLNMINLSLDLYKMEIGTYQLNPKGVDLLPIARRVLEELGRTAHSRRLRLGLYVEERLAREDEKAVVRGDDMLCYSMLCNLIKNAVEASPPGQEVTVRFETHGWCRVTIHNMGTVPEELRTCFFNKYATAGKAGGTGLGTYSARLFAETQGGRIGFTTSEREGTKVYVEMPCYNDS